MIISGNHSPNSYHITLGLGVARLLFVLLILLGLMMLAAFGFWISGAYRLTRLGYLERRNRQLEQEFSKLSTLRQRLEELEEQNRRVATMLGVELTPAPVDWDSARTTGSAGTHRTLAADSRQEPVMVVPLESYAVSRGVEPGHPGVDLAAQQGAAVRAAADGVVARRGTDPQFGRFLLIRHQNGYESYYGHLASWQVETGDTVRLGQTIGAVGSSGSSSAPHLHFEIRKGGKPIDPSTLIRF
ncbi:MAG: peptidoglycan DD-metalloendopeptidase family protein [candidate division WOR-3 bacterium]